MSEAMNTQEQEIEQEATAEIERLSSKLFHAGGASAFISVADLRELLRELATLRRGAAKPFDDAKLRAIEERAAKAEGGPWFSRQRADGSFVVVANVVIYPPESAGQAERICSVDGMQRKSRREELSEFIAHSREDIDTLLAALRSRGGEGEQKP